MIVWDIVFFCIKEPYKTTKFQVTTVYIVVSEEVEECLTTILSMELWYTNLLITFEMPMTLNISHNKIGVYKISHHL